MKSSKNAESIAGIIIAVVILSIAMLGIVNVLNFSRDISNNYAIKTDLEFLKTSAKNIASRLDLSNIEPGEEFFVYKNSASNIYQVFTGATFVAYRYIDKFGNKVENIEEFIGNIYERTFRKVVGVWDNNGTNVEFESIEIDLKKFER